MIPFNREYLSLLNKKEGLEKVLLETERQIEDFIKTANCEKDAISQLSAAISKQKNVLLLGMGASHILNHMFAIQLRKLGYRALAIPASEYYYDSFAVEKTVVILTSQSGESVETVKCLEKFNKNELFCVTLEKNSTLGNKCQSIVASGGGEKAFAGTRSVTLTLGIFSLLVENLGMEPGSTMEAIMGTVDNVKLQEAINSISHKKNLIVTGRGIYYGLGELFRLGCEELSGIPTICYETGQLRHGPLELLAGDTTLVLFRQDGVPGQLAFSLEGAAQKSGSDIIVFDSSGSGSLKGALTIPFLVGDSLASSIAILPALQAFMISYACKRNPQAGTPFYSSKITTIE